MSRCYPEYPIPAVSGVVLDGHGRALLVLRGRPPAEGLWSLPGGVVQLGEDLPEAVRREIREECGLDVSVQHLLDVNSRVIHDADGRIQYHYILIDYLCLLEDGVPHAGSDASDVRWVRTDKLSDYPVTEGLEDLVQKAQVKMSMI